MKTQIKRDDPYEIHSAWGAVAAFFLVQCFGFVVLQGFRMFLNIVITGSDSLSVFNADGFADRIFLPFWGLMFILAFVAFQADMFRRIDIFIRGKEGFSWLQGSSSPTEIFRLVAAVAFATTYCLFLAGKYPFPSKPISTHVSLLFSVFSWGVSAGLGWLIARYDSMPSRSADPQPDTESLPPRQGMVLGFIIGITFVAVALFVTPGLFYFHGMLGLGVLTMLMCQLLFKHSEKERNVANQRLERTGVPPAAQP